jgi:hypothetical protein
MAKQTSIAYTSIIPLPKMTAFGDTWAGMKVVPSVKDYGAVLVQSLYENGQLGKPQAFHANRSPMTEHVSKNPSNRRQQQQHIAPESRSMFPLLRTLIPIQQQAIYQAQPFCGAMLHATRSPCFDVHVCDLANSTPLPQQQQLLLPSSADATGDSFNRLSSSFTQHCSPLSSSALQLQAQPDEQSQSISSSSIFVMQQPPAFEITNETVFVSFPGHRVCS